MTDVQTAPARGRTRGRGGSYRGGRPQKTPPNGASANVDTLEENSELGQLKKRYKEQLNALVELL